jgi:hypothetical protein
LAKSWAAKSFFLGYAQWADRGVWVAVVSESGSALLSLKMGQATTLTLQADSGSAAFGPDRYRPAGGFEIVTEL